MFAALAFDRDPIGIEDLPVGVMLWLQGAGGFAALGLLLWFLLGLPRLRKQDLVAVPGWLRVLFVALSIASGVLYVAYFIAATSLGGQGSPAASKTVEILHSIAGGLAIVAVLLPLLLVFRRFSLRRIFALAKLSFKEAIRRRVLYAFTGMLLVFLFGSWFVPSMPKDQVRTYVQVVFLAMNLLLLFTAALMSSFSIPADIKQQTIHTIVTKPVERFEIVLGRFFGFLALMTLVLILMTSVSLLYVLGGIHPEAAAESLKAREPVYGELRFENTENESKGTNVGREWEYRSYISKETPGQEPPIARWDYKSVPAKLANRKEVRCEYTFDVYRTTKGEEGRAVSCTFRFYTWRYVRGNDELFRKDRGLAGQSDPERDSELAEKYGFFEIKAQPVTDYHTEYLYLPGGLFKNALAADEAREKELKASKDPKNALQIRVTCDSPTQYVGMAKYDFYVRQDDSTSERALFALNFFKGAFGIWLQLSLVTGLSVVLSTYLNGVISLLVTFLLYVGGVARDFVESVATGKNVGGGPTEAMVRIFRRELTAPGPDTSSLGDRIVGQSDVVFRNIIQRVLNLIPDVDRFDLTNYVAEGFSISFSQLGLDFLLLVAYLIPWLVLAFYLLRWREIASST